MKKIVAFALCAMAFASCSKEKDLYDPDAVSRLSVSQNVKNQFGVEFGADQDWSMIRHGEITVNPNVSDFTAVKVQILTGFPTKYKTAQILNEAAVGEGNVTLTFDAPDGVDTLYAAWVNAAGQYRAKAFELGDASISYEEKAAAARGMRRAEGAAPAIVGEGELSDNAKKLADGDARWAGSHWNDKLYDTQLKSESVSNFTTAERQTLNAIIQANVPEYSNNTARIKASDIYINTSNYFTATGQKEIQITPVACGAWFCGWEQLYYYYFNPDDVKGMTDAQRAEYLQQLPKFKIAEVAETFADQKYTTLDEKIQDSRKRYANMLNRVDRHYTYTLAYFGDNDKLDQQTYAFPAGYQIGIMLRIDSLYDNPNVQNPVKVNLQAGDTNLAGVNLYADRLLNDEVNYYAGWKSAGLGKGMSRAAIFGANGRNYVGFEDLKDDDFNDVVFEVTGGVEIIDERVLLDRQVYTLAFEDTELGDYDMNDVVIKAQRIDLTHVLFSLEATGARDEIYLRNIKGTNNRLNTTTEVHALFGQTGERDFVNTLASMAHVDAVQDVVEVPISFTFGNDNYLPYIYNASKGNTVKLSRRGEDPHGIVIPCDFQYPLERICVGGNEAKAVQNLVAYKKFNNWGTGKVDATDWYNYPTEKLIYTQSVFKAE